jgi:hypothetical protein
MVVPVSFTILGNWLHSLKVNATFGTYHGAVTCPSRRGQAHQRERSARSFAAVVTR